MKAIDLCRAFASRAWLFLLSVLLLAWSSPASGIEIVACGGKQVVIFDSDQADAENPQVKWSWSVTEATNLPPQYQKLLVPLDECKPVRTNTQLLLTSSGGGAVLLDRQSRKPLF
jgi:hypothetical protein